MTTPPEASLPKRDTEFSLAELATTLAAFLARDHGAIEPPADGRVRAAPDARTIRYYQSLGLVDRPLRYDGRQAVYGYRHLLQAAAVKLLQAQGLSLAQVQSALQGVSTAQLEDAVRGPSLGDVVGSPLARTASISSLAASPDPSQPTPPEPRFRESPTDSTGYLSSPAVSHDPAPHGSSNELAARFARPRAGRGRPMSPDGGRTGQMYAATAKEASDPAPDSIPALAAFALSDGIHLTIDLAATGLDATSADRIAARLRRALVAGGVGDGDGNRDSDGDGDGDGDTDSHDEPTNTDPPAVDPSTGPTDDPAPQQPPRSPLA